MVHQLLIIKKERKILFQQQIKKVNTEKNTACTYDYYYPKSHHEIFYVLKTVFVLTQFLDKKCTPYIPAIFPPFTEESNNK